MSENPSDLPADDQRSAGAAPPGSPQPGAAVPPAGLPPEEPVPTADLPGERAPTTNLAPAEPAPTTNLAPAEPTPGADIPPGEPTPTADLPPGEPVPPSGTPPAAYTPPTYAHPGWSAPPTGLPPAGSVPPDGAPPAANPPMPTYPPPPGSSVPPAGMPPAGSMPPAAYPPMPAYPMPPGFSMPPGSPPPGYYPGPADPLVSPDFAGWWTRGFALLKRAWPAMAGIQLLSVVPTLLLMLAWQFTAVDRFAALANDASADPWEIGKPLLIFVPAFLLVMLLGVVVELTTLQLAVQAATGQPISIGAALPVALRRTPAFIGWSFVGGLVILVGLVFCILPGIYAAVVLGVLAAVILVERGEGVGRCFQLFHANFGASLARIATVVGLGIGIGIAESIITTAIGASGSFLTADTASTSAPTAVIVTVISSAFSVLTGVLFPPLILTAYADMRARREPFSTAYLIPHTATPGPFMA